MPSLIDAWLTRLTNSPAAGRTAVRFVLFSAVPYIAYAVLVAVGTTLGTNPVGFVAALFFLSVLLNGFPYAMFDGDAAGFIGLPVSLLIGGFVTWLSRRRSNAAAFGIYILVAIVAAIAIHGLLAISGDPWHLMPRGGI